MTTAFLAVVSSETSSLVGAFSAADLIAFSAVCLVSGALLTCSTTVAVLVGISPTGAIGEVSESASVTFENVVPLSGLDGSPLASPNPAGRDTSGEVVLVSGFDATPPSVGGTPALRALPVVPVACPTCPLSSAAPCPFLSIGVKFCCSCGAPSTKFATDCLVLTSTAGLLANSISFLRTSGSPNSLPITALRIGA